MKSYSITDVGQKRTVNQDFVFTSETPVGNLPNLFVVADGMGGHKAGDFASSYAVEVLLSTIREDENSNPVKIIRAAIENANTQLLREASDNETMSGMGTTMVLVTIVGHYAYVANVGDSRLYLVDEIRYRRLPKTIPLWRRWSAWERYPGMMQEITRIKILLPGHLEQEEMWMWISLTFVLLRVIFCCCAQMAFPIWCRTRISGR